MQLGGNKERVKLIVDLTRYNPKLIVGELGWTIPNVKLSEWGSLDRFMAIKFDNGVSLDIAYPSIEKVEEI